jgi:(p)ppGpp synthase/HD superfamily hydrolase
MEKQGLEQAIALAVEAHRGQRDKAGQPYILHALRVMLMMESEAKRIAAVLHDTVEDCGLELGLIRHRFGSEISDAVDALTRRDGESYTTFIERCGANRIARSVKWADLCDNMDLTRLPQVSEGDRARNEKYRKARDRLNEIALAA